MPKVKEVGCTREPITDPEEAINVVAKEAEDIWEYSKKINRAEFANDVALIEHFEKKFKDFNSNYPFVLQQMVLSKAFHKKGFRKYLRLLKNKPWKNEDDFFESQADYMMILYESLNPKVRKSDAYKYRQGIIDKLNKERKEFKRDFKAVKERMEQEEMENKKLLREETRQYFMNKKNTM